jgi:hypothetical protein
MEEMKGSRGFVGWLVAEFVVEFIGKICYI